MSDITTAPPPLLVDDPEGRRLMGGLSAKTAYLLRRDRGLPYVRIGSRVMYRPADLVRWIEQQAQGVTR